MNTRQTTVLFLLFALLAGIAAWLQFGLSASAGRAVSATQNNHPDYYIENFESVGMSRHGRKYRLSAERLEHYPLDRRAALHRPHIIQYQPPASPRHIYADSGWLYNDTEEVLLSGNVRVIENPDAGGTVVTSQKMLIRLKGG